MKRLILCVGIILLSLFSIKAQYSGPFRTNFYDPDTLPRPFKAFVMSQIPDWTIFGVNRYLQKVDFAFINGNTITKNFMFTALWDNDLFGTNLLAHPIHGSMDYSGARASGMNYWMSFPYVFGASLVWEMVLENEPAAFNDQIATSVGGMALGEAFYRISASVFDNRAHGIGKVAREFIGTVFSPMQGINRMITGEMWKRGHYPAATPENTFPIEFGTDLSARYLRVLGNNGAQRVTPYFKFWMNYGDPFRSYNRRPFDAFTFNIEFDLGSKGNLLSNLEVCGLLKGYILDSKEDTKKMWGWFQHYRYMDNDALRTDSVSSIRYAQPASVGVGYLSTKEFPNGGHFKNESYANVIILGAAHASYFYLKGRDYNFGQGYGFTQKNELAFNKRIRIGLNLDFIQLFVWEGYKKGTVVKEQDPETFRAMGDRGNMIISMIKPYFEFRFTEHLTVGIESNLFIQFNNNTQFNNSTYKFNDTKLGIKYSY